MNSKPSIALTDLEQDLPTSRSDVKVLRRLRDAPVANPFAAVQALVDALPPSARRQRRDTAEGRPEFKL